MSVVGSCDIRQAERTVKRAANHTVIAMRLFVPDMWAEQENCTGHQILLCSTLANRSHSTSRHVYYP